MDHSSQSRSEMLLSRISVIQVLDLGDLECSNRRFFVCEFHWRGVDVQQISLFVQHLWLFSQKFFWNLLVFLSTLTFHDLAPPWQPSLHGFQVIRQTDLLLLPTLFLFFAFPFLPSLEKTVWLFVLLLLEKVVIAGICFRHWRLFQQIQSVRSSLLFFYDFYALRQFWVFEGSCRHRKLTFKFCLSEVVEETDLVANDLFADVDFLQIQQTEVTALAGLQVEAACVQMKDVLHFFSGEFQNKSLSPEPLRDGDVGGKRCKFEGNRFHGFCLNVGRLKVRNCDLQSNHLLFTKIDGERAILVL